MITIKYQITSMVMGMVTVTGTIMATVMGIVMVLK